MYMIAESATRDPGSTNSTLLPPARHESRIGTPLADAWLIWTLTRDTYSYVRADHWIGQKTWGIHDGFSRAWCWERSSHGVALSIFMQSVASNMIALRIWLRPCRPMFATPRCPSNARSSKITDTGTPRAFAQKHGNVSMSIIQDHRFLSNLI